MMVTGPAGEPQRFARGVSRYGGVLLEAARDALGLVEVVRHGRRRSLHFGSAVEQASHLPEAPDRLQFGYSRDLVLGTIFPPAAEQVLLLGLGAGTVARYLLCHSEEGLRLDAVEYREIVADMAFRHFDLPVDPRLEIYIASAGHYLDVVETRRDVILVDLYDADGMNAEAQRWSFLESCRARLAPDGVVAINLWRTDPAAFAFMLAQLRELFGTGLLRVDADDANSVVYCFAAGPPSLRDPVVRARLLRRVEALGFAGEAFLRRLFPVGEKTEN